MSGSVPRPLVRSLAQRLPMPWVRGAGERLLVQPGAISPLLTFSRAQGVGVQSSALGLDGATLGFFGADTPRFQGAARRLLIEGARTNLIVGPAAPATQDVTVAAVPHTLTLFGTGSITMSGAFAGTLNGTGASNRVSTTFTPAAGTLTLTVAGSVTRAQLEAGPFASSYIELAAGNAARSRDVVSAAMGSLGISAAAGYTILARAVFSAAPVTDRMMLFTTEDGGGGDAFAMTYEPPGNLWSVTIVGNGFGGTNLGAVAPGALFRAGIAVSGSRLAGCLNGGGVSVNSGVGSTQTTLRVGARRAVGDFPLFGEIDALRVLPRAVSDAELQALVAAL